MESIQQYMDKVCEGKLPLNNPILYQLQDIFNLIPNLNIEEFGKSFAVKTNDMMFMIYIASIVRSVLALHSLIVNKVSNREAERQEGRKTADDSTDKKEKETDKKKEEGGAGGGAEKKSDSGKTKDSKHSK